MQRPTAAVSLTCLVLLSACLIFASGCISTPTQSSTTQCTTPQCTTQGNTGTCTGTCTPYVSLYPGYGGGMSPGASLSFSATAHYGDPAVTWTVKEGPVGGSITDAGVYTAPSVEGVYHITATSKANPSVSATAAVAVTDTEFTPTGAQTYAMYGATVSLLQSGQVFIAGGGDDDYNFADPAQLYDPATATFRPSVKVSRWGHSATVLVNGDVLLAGGPSAISTTADLFKAGRGTIQATTGSMNTQRFGHAATLLRDGRVLLAGGRGDGKAIKSAELYDPASGTFTTTGDMTTPRGSPLSVLLPNGRVLIVGGGAAGAELYDPATNSFLPAPGVSASRCSTMATLLADGRVLIAGGNDCPPAPTVAPNILDTAEIYDPATGQSTPTGRLAAAQGFSSATLLPDGRVLLVGGTIGYLSQIYNPVTGAFTFGPHSHYQMRNAILLADGSVLIVGIDLSVDGNTGTLTAELYK